MPPALQPRWYNLPPVHKALTITLPPMTNFSICFPAQQVSSENGSKRKELAPMGEYSPPIREWENILFLSGKIPFQNENNAEKELPPLKVYPFVVIMKMS